MSNGSHNYFVCRLDEDNSIVTQSKPDAGFANERLRVTSSCLRVSVQLGLDLITQRRGQLPEVASRRGYIGDDLHSGHIADSYVVFNGNEAE
jgi:hypothetical protein